MGLMRLFVENRERISQLDPSRVFMAGMDELPWFGHVLVRDDHIVIQRAESDSGCVSLPWHVAGRGHLLLATTTLMEREEPYFLEIELARGLVQRIRNQLASWEMMGLATPDSLRDDLATATQQFSRAATRQSHPAEAAQLAESAIDLGVQIAEQLADAYARQALTARLSSASRLGTLSGVDIGDRLPVEEARDAIRQAFNMVALPMSWRSIEASEGKRHWGDIDEQLRWAQESEVKIMAGPLLEFDERRVPDWTYLWEGDSDTLGSFMLDHVRSVAKRYRGKVHLWHVAARMNREHVLSLDEEERLQLVAQAVRAVRQVDARTPVLVSFDQPWAEYMATQQTDLAPWHYADALVRADLGIAGLGLELNIGPQPQATANRTPLAFSRLIDQWSLFDLPLMVTLTISSDATDETTADWIERHVPILLAKNCVQLVVWNQLSDADADVPGSGLLDTSGQSKPELATWRELRERYLT